MFEYSLSYTYINHSINLANIGGQNLIEITISCGGVEKYRHIWYNILLRALTQSKRPHRVFCRRSISM